MNNRGTILVYDREVKYVRRIEQDGMGAFFNLVHELGGGKN